MPIYAHGVAGLVLAAGGGTRLGGCKLLLPWRGRSLIIHVLDAAIRSGCLMSLSVVLGNRAAELRSEIEKYIHESPLPVPVRIVENFRWLEGQSSSLQCGISSILASSDAATVRSVMVVLGDQPMIAAKTLGALIQAHSDACIRDPGHPATAPSFRGRRGNPVILSRELFADVMQLRGDVGARNLLAALGERLLVVPTDDPGVVRDIDAPEDYAALP